MPIARIRSMLRVATRGTGGVGTERRLHVAIRRYFRHRIGARWTEIDGASTGSRNDVIAPEAEVPPPVPRVATRSIERIRAIGMQPHCVRRELRFTERPDQ